MRVEAFSYSRGHWHISDMHDADFNSTLARIRTDNPLAAEERAMVDKQAWQKVHGWNLFDRTEARHG